MINFSIHLITEDDFFEWKNLWRNYLSFYKTSVSKEVYISTFSRLVNPDIKNQNGLVAKTDKQLIGLAHYISHPHNWKVEDIVYLQDLYVASNFRRKGVARKLMSDLFNIADMNETPSVYWLTQDFNLEARKLYDDVGEVTHFIKYNR